MARDNYSYEKYKRELAKKKKREEKAQHKQEKKDAKLKEASGRVPGATNDAGQEPLAASVPVPDTETR